MKLSLKALRANSNLTQKEAANIIGVSRDTWNSWEKGRSVPNARNIDTIIKCFNVPYENIQFLPESPVKIEKIVNI